MTIKARNYCPAVRASARGQTIPRENDKIVLASDVESTYGMGQRKGVERMLRETPVFVLMAVGLILVSLLGVALLT
jgi:hypothetical protein